MEPVEQVFREVPRHEADWILSGAKDRPPRVVRSLHLKAEDLEAHNRDLQAKYAEIHRNETRWATEDLDDAEYALVAYGTSARVCAAWSRWREPRASASASSGPSRSGRSRRTRSSGAPIT